MDIALNIATGIILVAIGIIWLNALWHWDEKLPCEPEDCNDCPYRGTGCHPNQNHKTER